jgi:hypothetical protein
VQAGPPLARAFRMEAGPLRNTVYKSLSRNNITIVYGFNHLPYVPWNALSKGLKIADMYHPSTGVSIGMTTLGVKRSVYGEMITEKNAIARNSKIRISSKSSTKCAIVEE